ncbi:Glutathione-regulated potassium-efflux system protein KefB [Photobacterium marinum]|uniref:Glutathione-regulated potassium-efflux system protein KefB n=1 Tax=Photobacterium marinum TaxID=1056511 RepID=L8JF18_9GAMM|nr:cation:proton antiporter [Photobacterium marinum]ELR66818.1 Glutathione-regulated potassium-efflux system protein KefB [Photobacterium marinum]
MQVDLAPLIFELCTIVISAAVLGTLFLYARQPIILAYIASGMLIGPSGLAWIRSSEDITQIGNLGVILLLFLIGLNLQPKKLISLFKESAFITLGTCCFFFTGTLIFALAIQLPLIDALIIAAALMFSSTVIGLKLIPTTTLHHQRVGEMMTSILLMQDILAISVIIFLNIGDGGNSLLLAFVMMLLKFAALCSLAFLGVRHLILPLFRRFDVIQEYSFITTLGWCLFWAELSHQVGLSYESGAFIAGISIAVSRVSQAISVHLKPLREFFLILFFFAIGARMELSGSDFYSLLGVLFGAMLVAIKAWGFSKAFHLANEKPTMIQELSARLSQASEFSFLVVYAAINANLLSMEASMFIQTATMTTFVISTYWVVKRFPTPISIASHLRQD